MKRVFRFHYNPARDLIHIPGKLWGSLGYHTLNLVFDSGAYRTIINTRVADSLGYQAVGSNQKISTSSVTGLEEGYTLTVQRFCMLDFQFDNVELCCFDLPETSGIDGLIGLDILEKFEVTLRHRNHWIQFTLLA
jgi:predicted aspartyl protease